MFLCLGGLIRGHRGVLAVASVLPSLAEAHLQMYRGIHLRTHLHCATSLTSYVCVFITAEPLIKLICSVPKRVHVGRLLIVSARTNKRHHQHAEARTAALSALCGAFDSTCAARDVHLQQHWY